MDIEKLNSKQLILASGSPRRQAFLKDLGLNYKIEFKEIAEIYPKHLKKEAITNYLALKKARVFNNLNDQDILISADTIVWFKNKALGKPENIEQAKEMLKKLSNHKHLVITSVCLKSQKKEIVFSCKTEVYFDKLSDDVIDYYLKNYKPLDKAGSYGIQEWIGFVGVKKIKGSYSNVMGFPVHKFYKELMQF